MPSLFRIIASLLPIAELAIFIVVADQIGFGNALLIQLGSMAAGLIAIQLLGQASLREVLGALDRQEPPGPAMLRGACVLAGGALMIVPGFLTDLIGLLLLVPGAGALIGRSLWGAAQIRRPRPQSSVIEGDWHEIPPEQVESPRPSDIHRPE